jgi:nucleoside-diphosphate-sugar epimerase
MIANTMDAEVEFEIDPARIRPQASEVFRLLCDTSKYQSLIGDRKIKSLQDGISLTVQWFQNPDNLKKYKTGIYNV